MRIPTEGRQLSYGTTSYDWFNKWAVDSDRFCLFFGQKYPYARSIWTFRILLRLCSLLLIVLSLLLFLILFFSHFQISIQLKPFNLHLNILPFQCRRKLVIPSPCHCVQIAIINICTEKVLYHLWDWLFLTICLIYRIYCIPRFSESIQIVRRWKTFSWS